MLAGILVENVNFENLNQVIIGIGINIHSKPVDVRKRWLVV